MGEQFRARLLALMPSPGEARRYLVIGGCCAALNNLILIGGDRLGFHYSAGLALSVLVTAPLGYALHARWTFGAPLSWAGFTRFLGGLTSSLFMASALVAALAGGLRLPMVVAAPAATILMIAWNFMATRWAVLYRASFRSGGVP